MREYNTVGYKRRAYEDVARILGEPAFPSSVVGRIPPDAADIIGRFVKLFSDDNPRFDSERFHARIAEYATGKR